MQAQSSDFDEYFKRSAIRYLYGYLPGDDWRWLKAQAIQESWLDPNAVSPAGAAGILQLMPGAAKDANLSWADRFDAEKNIRAGAWILRRNLRTWWPRETRMQRLKLAWCGYNAGPGNCIRAQLLCGGASLWEDIAPCLSRVTGHHAVETIGYIERIPKWYSQIKENDK